jgi:D-lyxose ketol-isomerase
MRRSQVNTIMREAEAFIRGSGLLLPPFARWSPGEMQARRADIGRIVDARLGWDITDYGQGRFDTLGLVLFTLRNGRAADLRRGRGVCYAEKLMISRRDQFSPMHTHAIKAEDIINRGGAVLALRLHGSAADGSPDPGAPVRVACDGVVRTVRGGDVLRLAPGESVTLLPGDWHAFWGEGGDVLIGEVSTVNDDLTDNIFAGPIGRFGTIEEDEPPLHLLVSDYPAFLERHR